MTAPRRLIPLTVLLLCVLLLRAPPARCAPVHAAVRHALHGVDGGAVVRQVEDNAATNPNPDPNSASSTDLDDGEDDDDDDDNDNRDDDDNDSSDDPTSANAADPPAAAPADSSDADQLAQPDPNTADAAQPEAAADPAQDNDDRDDAADNTQDDENSDANPVAQGQAASNETDTAEAALAAFELLQKVPSIEDSEADYKPVALYRNLTFIGPFEGSPSTSDIATLEAANSSLWYEDTAMQDRISFEFRYNSDLEGAYAIAAPTIGITEGSGIEPTVEFEIHDVTGTGSFTVHYHCMIGRPGTFIVGLTMPVTTAGGTFNTAWRKTCGSGAYTSLNFGFLDHNSEVIPFNADGTYGIDEHRKLEVGPMDATTDLKAVLVAPATHLNFSAPYAMSDNPNVGLKLRSTVAAGTFRPDIDTLFTVLYDCEGKATANVKFTVGIPPWDNITATWRKDCGGSMSQALLIGTGGSQSFDVMQEGQLQPEFAVSPDSTVDSVDPRVRVLPPDVHVQRFTLSNSDDTSDIHFQKVSVTLSNPNALKVLVATTGAWDDLPSTGTVLERGDVKTLNLYFICSTVGSSVVLITLPTVRYQNVEFGFVKQCDGPPKTYRHVGFMQTAGSLLDVMLVLAVAVGIVILIYVIRKKRIGQSYDPVSTVVS